MKSFFLLLAVCWLVGSPTALSQEKPANKSARGDDVQLKIFNGKDLKGIKILDKTYFEDHGPVRVTKGNLILTRGMPGTGIAIAPKLEKKIPRINYEVAITAQRVDGGDFFCGLTFPVNKSYCTLILGGWGGGAIGLSNVDSMSAIENETSEFHEFKNQRWYDINLTVTEKTIRATLKEEGAKQQRVLFELETADHKFDIWWEQEPARPLGITTWNTTAAIKKFEVKKLKVAKSKSK